MRMRPDALIQGIGCLCMGGTVFVLKAMDSAGRLLDLDDRSGLSIHLLAACSLVLAPCCICCGGLMVWHGLGGEFGTSGLSARLRCDLPPCKASEGDDEERAR